MAGATLDTLRCDVCGKTVECRTDDLLLLAQTAWPRCCGETMELVLPDPADGDPPAGGASAPQLGR